MTNSEKGIHHISILCGDAQVNVDFYTKILGLRMVLKTVNQDDPSTYHLFYANGEGQPGSSITFFSWPNAAKGEAGTGQNSRISFGVPKKSKNFWIEHFDTHNIAHSKPAWQFSREYIEFEDPDGLTLSLVFDENMDDIAGWSNGEIPEESSVRGFWSATLRLEEGEPTADILENVLGFEYHDSDSGLIRYQSNSAIGRYIIIEETGERIPTKAGRGVVHHIAFRAEDENELRKMRAGIKEMGLQPTEVIDRHVFKSVYYQTPGGVLFEMATDGPGYESAAGDEERMGKSLFLPPWLESKRDQIEKSLPQIQT